MTKIGKSAIEKCTAFKKIVIPDKITKIGDQAFSGNKNMTDAIIGKKVTKIGKQALKGRRKLGNVIVKVFYLTKATAISDKTFCQGKMFTVLRIEKDIQDSFLASMHCECYTKKERLSVKTKRKTFYTVYTAMQLK